MLSDHTLLLVAAAAPIVAALVIVGFLRFYLPSYFTEKGKNLATKEDIEEITRKIEAIKTDLRKDAYEQEVRFSRLHVRRAAVIGELYKLLVKVSWAAESLANPFQFVGQPSKAEVDRDLHLAISEYFRYFEQHRIFLPADLWPALDAYVRTLRGPALQFGVWLQLDYLTPRSKEEMEEARQNLEAFVKNDVPKMREAIEHRFRAVLEGAGEV